MAQLVEALHYKREGRVFEKIQVACMCTDTFQSILCVRCTSKDRQVTLIVCFRFQVYVREYVWHVQNM